MTHSIYKPRFLVGLLIGLMTFFNEATLVYAKTKPHSIAFYYGEAPLSAEQLSSFDLLVLEPDHAASLNMLNNKSPELLAYVSVGEVNPSRSYYSAIPTSWFKGENTIWQSIVIDQSNPDWTAFLIEHVFTPLWQQGYTGFFLDTLDSYQLISDDELILQRNREGLVHTIQQIHTHFPQAKIILNRGFELLPEVHDRIYAIAFESLFQGWDEATHEYIEVPKADQEWLLAQIDSIQRLYELPIIAIDYCPPENITCTTTTLEKIRKLGVTPYISDGHLTIINTLSNQ